MFRDWLCYDCGTSLAYVYKTNPNLRITVWFDTWAGGTWYFDCYTLGHQSGVCSRAFPIQQLKELMERIEQPVS